MDQREDEGGQPARRGKDLRAAVGVLGVGLLLLLPGLMFDPAVNRDVAAIGAVAERMLTGEQLYTDLPQPNPPWAFYGSAVVLAFAGAVGWSSTGALMAASALLCAGLIGLTMVVSHRVRIPEASTDRWALWLVLTVAVFGYMNGELGQREQLVVLAMLPYLLASSAEWVGRAVPSRLALITGLVAGLGVALKPQFVLAPALVELAFLVKLRSPKALLRPSAVGGLGAVLGTTGWVVFGTDYVANVQRWASGYQSYGALGATPEEIAWTAVPWTWVPAAGLAIGLWKPLRDKPERAFLMSLALLGAVATLSLVLQGKGFNYHLWPIHVGAALALSLALVPLRDPERSPLLWWVSHGLVLVLMGLMGNTFLSGSAVASASGVRAPSIDCGARKGFGAKGRECAIADLADLVAEHTDPGDRIAWLAPSSYPTGLVALRAQVVDSVSVIPMLLPDRYPASAYQQKPFPYRPADERDPIEQAVIDGFADDLERHEPVLVVIDHRRVLRGFGETTFDLLAFYQQDDRIRSTLESRYTEVSTDPINGAYRFFVRTPSDRPQEPAP